MDEHSVSRHAEKIQILWNKKINDGYRVLGLQEISVNRIHGNQWQQQRQTFMVNH